MVIASDEKDGGYLLSNIDGFKSMVSKLKLDTPASQPNAKPTHRRKAEY